MSTGLDCPYPAWPGESQGAGVTRLPRDPMRDVVVSAHSSGSPSAAPHSPDPHPQQNLALPTYGCCIWRHVAAGFLSWGCVLPFDKKSTPNTPCIFRRSQKCSCRLICS